MDEFGVYFTLGHMKYNMPLGEIVANRELEFTDSYGKKQSVQVSLGKPTQEQNGPWFCPYKIKAQDFEKQFRIAGEDSMQALMLTIKTVSVELEVLASHNNGSFTWLGENDLGF